MDFIHSMRCRESTTLPDFSQDGVTHSMAMQKVDHHIWLFASQISTFGYAWVSTKMVKMKWRIELSNKHFLNLINISFNLNRYMEMGKVDHPTRLFHVTRSFFHPAAMLKVDHPTRLFHVTRPFFTLWRCSKSTTPLEFSPRLNLILNLLRCGKSTTLPD